MKVSSVVISVVLHYNHRFAESLNNTIPVIPLAHIQQWLERYTIVAADSVQGTPILGTADQRVLAGKGQKVYARGNGLVVGQRYAVYREADPYALPMPMARNTRLL